MKKPVRRRFAIERETVKIMVSELSVDQLRRVDAGAASSGGGTSIISTGPSFECPSRFCTIG